MTDPDTQRTAGGVLGRVAGKAKELSGELTGNEDLAREGRLQQAQADADERARREAAEAELLRRRGQEGLFGRTPRVRYEVDFSDRLWFGQEVEIELAIVRLGEKSMRYEFTVRSGSSVAASGSMVVAFAVPDSPHAAPWPEDVRAALGGG